VTAIEQMFPLQGDEETEKIKKKLGVYSNGVLYRSKRVHKKIRSQQPQTKRSEDNSNGSSSCGVKGGGLSPLVS